MAAAGCVFHRTLTRVRTGTNNDSNNKVSSSSTAICRESLYVVDVLRYTRDQGSSVYFPQAVLNGDNLYDVILSDGDCRLHVTLDPGLNRLVERNVLQPGSMLCDATFVPAMAAQRPACTGASGETESYRLSSAEVRGQTVRGSEGGVRRLDVDHDSLPWFGSSTPAGPLVPLRATRGVFLPLWNNVDYLGEVWRETPSTDEEEEDEDGEEEAQRPGVTVSELRDAFLSGHRSVVRGAVQQRLIVRIINKSCLVYYGKPDQWGICPYKAVFEVCDHTGSVCAVLWTSVPLRWYRYLKPGDVISLRRYRVKRHFQMELDDIEISINSRNPAAHISVIPESSVSPEYLPPAPSYNFFSSKDLVDRPLGDAVCDVIGLLTFSGRPERMRVKGGRGEELLEYRWLRLEDGASDRPIMVKLFCTSQPETHSSLHPLSVVVCTRLKLIKSTDETRSCFFLTNTTYTQVYCTGRGDHSRMSYRKLRPVRLFLQWLRTQDDAQVLSRALIGGSFMFPPRPVSLETYMKERRGEPSFLRGAELQRELKELIYRERRTFCIQATVTMVAYSCRGEEDRCLFWTDRASSRSPSSSSSSPRVSHPSPSPSHSSPSLPPLPSTPRSFRPPLSSTSTSSPLSPTSSCSAVCQLTPPPLDHKASKRRKRKQLLQCETPKKRHPLVTLQEEETNQTVILFEASMEFLENTVNDEDSDDDDDDDDDGVSFVTAPLPPTFTPIAMETLPMRYNHTHREEQAAAMAMGGWAEPGRFDSAFDDYYTLRLRALSDGVMVDALFLPDSSSSSPFPPLLPHTNTWTSILSHGAFSSHQPPPSPADLINMAAQLTNQRLVCVLEACHLGGGNVELILSRAFHLLN